MVRFSFDALLVLAALWAVDYYVYRNWRGNARLRRWGRRTLPLYKGALWIVPLTLPLGVLMADGGGLASAPWPWLVLWSVYYVPKLLIATAILVKDVIHGIVWLFRWFQKELLDVHAPPSVLAPVPASALAAATPSVDLTDMKRMKRREFLQQMDGNKTKAAPFVMVGYGVFKQLYDFEVHHVDVPIADLPNALDGLTIAQLSDLHAGSFFSTKPMQEAVELVHSLRPDLITITGDFVNFDASELPLILPGLNALRADLGVYGCLGNHDHYAHMPDIIGPLQQTPMDLLNNTHHSLLIDGAKLHLIGTDNTGHGQQFGDLQGAMRGLIRSPHGEEATILLAHDPTFWDTHVRTRANHIDLTLSGHTHGGQIGIERGALRFGLNRPLYRRWAGLYAEERQETPHAMATDGHQLLYVNRGLGTIGPPLRLGIRPEITLLTLRRASAAHLITRTPLTQALDRSGLSRTAIRKKTNFGQAA